MVEGRIAESRRLYDEATEIVGNAPDVTDARIWFISNHAVLALAEGDRTGAVGSCRRVLEAFAEQPHRPSEVLATVLDVLAVLAVEDGDLERAARLVGAAHTSRAAPKFAPFRSRPEFQRALTVTRAGLDDAAFERTQAVGAALDIDEVVALAEASLR
ncbi:MAG: hypothetical protein ACRD2W_19960 [Acidimicrobiales bacterium]